MLKDHMTRISTWLDCWYSAHICKFINSKLVKVQFQQRLFSVIIHEHFRWMSTRIDILTSTINLPGPSQRHFIGVMAARIKRAAVCLESSFGPKLGISSSPMVRGWPRCHGYSTLISMQTPSRCTGRLTAGRGRALPATAPSHTNTTQTYNEPNVK